MIDRRKPDELEMFEKDWNGRAQVSVAANNNAVLNFPVQQSYRDI